MSEGVVEERLVWHLAAHVKPRIDADILMQWPGHTAVEPTSVDKGWWDGTEWRLAESGGVIRAPRYWTEMPKGPAR